MPESWNDRAAAAEAAVTSRHLRRLWGLPGTRQGVVASPSDFRERLFIPWHYWWQAHLLDCLIDAELRAPSKSRRASIRGVVRAQRIHNLGRWTNDFYDDMAWLALALQRAQDAGLAGRPRAINAIADRIRRAWSNEHGGIPWNTRDTFRNTPANGPAAILLARLGHLERAEQMARWIGSRLYDPDTGLVFDGLHPEDPDGSRGEFFSYNQGVVLGAETELARRSADSSDHQRRVADLVTAIRRHLATDDVLHSHGTGDHGLFTGILARYLGLVWSVLPATSDAGRRAKAAASELIRCSADAAWANAGHRDGLPVFGANWTGPAADTGDLSVQLGGWMLIEAAAAVER